MAALNGAEHTMFPARISNGDICPATPALKVTFIAVTELDVVSAKLSTPWNEQFPK
jgi:hypothetical protein